MVKSVMLVGTASSVGKSTLAAAICRILYQDGYNVAPFKAQNMSLNSAVTPSGREIGRAQAVQAEACGLLPNEHMNPVLLKPTGEMRSQIVLQGRALGTRLARDYFADAKDQLWSAVVESYDYLAARHDVIVIEGAGSPVEMNLKHRDIANMRTAEMADADVILVADIDRGGVFASIVGTLQLLEPHERARVKGVIINKFRGDASLFNEGKSWLEAQTGVPVLGVIPFIRDIGIDEEDSVGLESNRYQRSHPDSSSQVHIGIVQLPHISNFTDCDPLFVEPDVHAFFCTTPRQLAEVDVIILPGTKSTIVDLQWLHDNGWVLAIRDSISIGKRVLGICGGYQMLGTQVTDPDEVESSIHACAGLGLLPVVTTIGMTKRTILVEGVLTGRYSGIPVQGYEIHMGVTERLGSAEPLAHIQSDSRRGDEGCIAPGGRIIGTYLHGILHNDAFRTAWLNDIRSEKGLLPRCVEIPTDMLRSAAYDRLADIVRTHLDTTLLSNLTAHTNE